MASFTSAAAPARTPVLAAGVDRIVSVDIFRGFTMVCMVAEGFGLLFFLQDPLLGPLANQFRHQDWQGVHAWDLVQPFFLFIVGVVMPVSFRRRWAAGETWLNSLRHVLRRGALLILLGLLAGSIQAGKPVIDLINVLAQIAFTYLAAFLVLRKPWTFQAAIALQLLFAHWALYRFASAPGVAGPWVKDANIGAYLDRVLLGGNWPGSYATVNCLSSAANTIFGVMAGELLIGALPLAKKARILAYSGMGAILAGLALDPLIPIIKRIWTASFALYSTGFSLLALLVFYWICDVKQYRRWAQVFLVVGSNSIFIYVFHETLRGWLSQTGLVFTRWAVDLWGPAGQVLNVWLVILFQIYVCYWLYQRKIFFKL